MHHDESAHHFWRAIRNGMGAEDRKPMTAHLDRLHAWRAWRCAWWLAHCKGRKYNRKEEVHESILHPRTAAPFVADVKLKWRDHGSGVHNETNNSFHLRHFFTW